MKKLKVFKVGDIVIAAGDVSGASDDSSFPHWGGKHGKVKGVVARNYREDGSTYLRVEWENGKACDRYPRRFVHYSRFRPVKEVCMKYYPKVKESKWTKYLGLLALAIVLDHFVLNGAFRKRFITLAESLVNRTLACIDAIIEKIGAAAKEIEE